MRAYDIIDKKKKGETLSKEEIDFFCNGYVGKDIPDYQMSALLMAVCLKGMNDEETYYLTQAMLHSGETCDLSSISGYIVDKHSTGGVGDTTTLALAPILACCGVKCAKMSGRGLGFTGGTLDKLESIEGYKTSLSMKEFAEIVNKVGCAVIGQTDNLVPADKKMYALRDVTATVDCIPLICASIMSKKLASGSDYILLDVKYGEGAFMKTPEEAVELSTAMVRIGKAAGKHVSALVTDMSQPLSSKIGNSLEVISAIEILNGKRNRLYTEIVEVGSRLLEMTGTYTRKSGAEQIEKVIKQSKALDKFKEMVSAQGGSVKYIDNPNLFKLGKTYSVTANQDGYVSHMKTEDIGNAVAILGGGRIKKDDTIDHSVGLELHVVLGDAVKKGQTIATLYHNDKGLEEAEKLIKSAITVTDKPQNKEHKIAYAYVTADGVEKY